MLSFIGSVYTLINEGEAQSLSVAVLNSLRIKDKCWPITLLRQKLLAPYMAVRSYLMVLPIECTLFV